MKQKLSRIFIGIFIGIILFISVFISGSLQFQINGWLRLFTLFIVFILAFNYFLKRMDKKESENIQKKSNHSNLSISIIYAVIFSIFSIPITNALFALHTNQYGKIDSLILKGTIYHPTFSLQRKPCKNRLYFPESPWSSFNYICLDDRNLPPQTTGYYQVKIQSGIFGSNILDYQWLGVLDKKQILMLDPKYKGLIEAYKKLNDLSPPMTLEEAQEFMSIED